jgi:hypothetical protein
MTTRNTREELENSVHQYGAEVTRLQARLDELEGTMNFGERVKLRGNGEIVGEDTNTLFATFNYYADAKAFVELINNMR